jgi:hypothetical protein
MARRKKKKKKQLFKEMDVPWTDFSLWMLKSQG